MIDVEARGRTRAATFSAPIATLLLTFTLTPSSSRAEGPLAGIKVVNVGGPYNGYESPRSQRPDFMHVDLKPGSNRVVANVNEVDLSTLFGRKVRTLRASNVPLIPVRSAAWVDPALFVQQATRLGAKRIVATTGVHSVQALKVALQAGGYTVRIRKTARRRFVTARRQRR